jgi:hypothetical protein
MNRRLFGTLTALALTLGTASAAASPSYPEAIQDATGSPCAPQCILCHRDQNGGSGTIDAPFGKTLVDEIGLEEDEPDRIADIIAFLKDQEVDSDQDGVDDVTELRQGRDPNEVGAGVLCGPTYGCGATVAPRAARRSDGSSLATLSAALVAFGMLLRVRRAR